MKNSPPRPDPARLLEAFVAANRCDRTFTKLVESLYGLVYSSALRRTGNARIAKVVEAADNPQYREIRNDLIQLTLDHFLRENGIEEVSRQAQAMALTPDEIGGYLDSTGGITMITSPRATVEWMSEASELDPESAQQWANEIQDEQLRKETLRQVKNN